MNSYIVWNMESVHDLQKIHTWVAKFQTQTKAFSIFASSHWVIVGRLLNHNNNLSGPVCEVVMMEDISQT